MANGTRGAPKDSGAGREGPERKRFDAPAPTGHDAGMPLTTVIIPVPSSEREEPSRDIRDLAEVERAHHHALLGHDDLHTSAESIVFSLAHQDRARRLRVLARDGAGRAVGAANLAMPLTDNRHLGYFFPNWAPPGPEDEPVTEGEVIDALWAAVLPVLREHGRTAVQSWVLHTRPSGEHEELISVLTPSTGVGTLPADERARWLVDHGFVLEQVELYSVQELTPEARSAGREALGADTGYEIRTWVGPTPEELVEQMALLRTRMSTDTPSGELDQEEESWDADRVRDLDRRTQEMGSVAITAAALSRDGTVAGYSCVEIPPEAPTCAHQQDTLVLTDHRGHGLGRQLKAAVMHELAEHHPQVRRVHTWNAAENAHMLTINRELGYRQVGTEGGWQLRLD